ncbi:MAG: type II secretion system protein [Candidatus Taylorbacteria bacterium]
MKKGFTIIELLISVSIFVAMTVLMIVKFGNFDQSILITNLIYDVALVMRTAQTYGLSVASSPGMQSDFQFAYGVDFSTAATTGIDNTVPGNTRVIMFADSGVDTGIYEGSGPSRDTQVNTYNITRNTKVTSLCIGASDTNCSEVTQLDVSFKRPNPEAIISASGFLNQQYARITITGTDKSTRSLEVHGNGQVSIIQ